MPTREPDRSPLRDFVMSFARDRQGGTPSVPTYSSILYFSSVWGGSEWSIQRGDGFPIPSSVTNVSGTRYGKMRLTQRWNADQNSAPLGEERQHIDEIDYGSGLNDPVLTNIRADTPWFTNNAYPKFTGSGALISESATHMEFSENLGPGLYYNVRRELIEPDENFAQDFMALTYLEFSQMSNFQKHATFSQDRAMWSKGPLTYIEDANGTVNHQSSLFPNKHTLNPTLRYLGLGLGSDVFIVARPPGDGAVSRMNANAFRSGVLHASIPNQFAGGVILSPTTRQASMHWFQMLTKVAILQFVRNKVGYHASGNPINSQGAVQFSCQVNAPIQNGILEPPIQSQVNNFKDRHFAFKTSPDWQSFLIPITPSCFTP